MGARFMSHQPTAAIQRYPRLGFSVGSNPSASKTRLKHIDTRQDRIRMLRNKNLVVTRHVPSEENLADLFTKILLRPTFVKLRDQLLKNRPIKDRLK